MPEVEPRFMLVQRDGVDTFHVEHPHEECNVDDAVRRELVDEMTAEAMRANGSARLCGHCKPDIAVRL